nr:DUF2914 domain-containing protein [uncultured Desulfobacter sp.]
MTNKTSIEERDRRLIKKFRNIIEEKKQLEQQAPQKRSWSIFKPAAFIMGASIMVVGIIFMVYQMIPERALTDPSSTPEKVETASSKNPASMAQHTLNDVEKPNLPNEKPAQVLLSETAPVLSTEEEPPHSEVVKTPEAAPIETLPEIVSTTDVTIHELVICRSVKNRKYISPGNRFSMENGAKPVVWTWMNVLTDKPPQSLSHIYYLNGKRYCRVILPAPYPRTRTWSNVKLNKPEHAGSWRVDVVNSRGQVIARADFTVEN